MPEPAQAEGLIPKQLAMLCANEAVRGAAGAPRSLPGDQGPLLPGLHVEMAAAAVVSVPGKLQHHSELILCSQWGEHTR